MSKLSIVFFGTPEFATSSLVTLIENHFPFTCLKGSHEIRLKLATEAVQNLIKNNYAYRKRSN